jgi:hypothetical protein
VLTVSAERQWSSEGSTSWPPSTRRAGSLGRCSSERASTPSTSRPATPGTGHGTRPPGRHLAPGDEAPDAQVLGNREVGEDLAPLRDQRDSRPDPSGRRPARDVLPRPAHRPRVRPDEAGDAADQARLARTIAPHHGHAPARRDCEVHRAQRKATAVADLEAVHVQPLTRSGKDATAVARHANLGQRVTF